MNTDLKYALSNVIATFCEAKTAVKAANEAWETFVGLHAKDVPQDEYFGTLVDGTNTVGKMYRLIADLELLERRLATPEIFQGNRRPG